MADLEDGIGGDSESDSGRMRLAKHRDLFGDLLGEIFYWRKKNRGGYLVGIVAGRPVWLHDNKFPEGR